MRIIVNLVRAEEGTCITLSTPSVTFEDKMQAVSERFKVEKLTLIDYVGSEFLYHLRHGTKPAELCYENGSEIVDFPVIAVWNKKVDDENLLRDYFERKLWRRCKIGR